MHIIDIISKNGNTRVFIDGMRLKGVVDYQIKKTSAQESAEVTLVLDANNLNVSIQE